MPKKRQTKYFTAEHAERDKRKMSFPCKRETRKIKILDSCFRRNDLSSASSATSTVCSSLAYKKSGVDINQTTKIKSNIKSLVKKTFSPQVLSDIGLFGGLYELNLATEPQRTQRTSFINKKFTATEPPRIFSGVAPVKPGTTPSNLVVRGSQRTQRKNINPVLVASCDGIGTKVLVANMMNKHNTVGEDLVNHCVNDILTLGAKPIFFLDYVAYSDVDSKVIEQVISGLANGCKKNKCALIGGETAMMPGMYKKGEYDLVGFIVGKVEKNKIIDGKKINIGDKLIGIPSTGLHTNGYSLARKVFFTDNKFKVHTKLPGLKQSLGETLLKTHHSYLKQVYPLLPYISAIAHITGGAFYKNIIRLLPKNLSCIIYKDKWQVPQIFRLIQKYGKVSEQEMYSVFNMGIGMVLFTKPNNVTTIMKKIPKAKIIGEVIKGNFGVQIK